MTNPWKTICRIDEIAPGRPIGRTVHYGNRLRGVDVPVCVVARGKSDYVALLDRCPHRDVALSGGIVRDGTLMCPGHFWRFDLHTGARTDAGGAPEFSATVYPTRVVDGWVQARIPPPVERLSMREWLLAEAERRSAPDAHRRQP